MPIEYQFHKYADFFPLIEGAEFEALVEDIRRFGIREKIWLFQDQILDGRNRYRACIKSSVMPQFRQFIGSEEDALNAVMSWNLERRHLNVGQRSLIAVEILPELERIAKEKQRESGGDRKSEDYQRSVQVNSPEPIQETRKPAPQARDIAAKTVGIGSQAVQRAKKVVEKRPDLAEQVKSGKITLNQANTEIRREERLQKIADIAIGNTNLSAIAGSPSAPNQFPVIYADPPWRYEHVKTDNRAIENQYPTMALEEICALPVADLATPDAILFLWTTSPKLDESLDVVDAWGFTYRTCAVWDKEKIGMGYYFRQQHELLLVATRGSIPVPPVESRVSSVLRYPRGEHSAKPLEVARIIEAMYPELPKVELFCRNPQPGWFAWGNQAYEAAA